PMRAARRLRVLDGRRRRKRDAVLAALLAEPLWGRELARRLRGERGCGHKHLHRYLRRLARDGLLVAAARGPGPTGRVYWTLTDAGRLVCLRFALPGGGTGGRDDRERAVAGGMAAVLSEQQIVVAAWY